MANKPLICLKAKYKPINCIITFSIISLMGIIITNLILKSTNTKNLLIKKRNSIPVNKTELVLSRIESLSCKAIENIVFLKTHKCGSSTIQNIFLRYGDSNGLTFALPSVANYFGHPRPFVRRMVPPLNTMKLKFGKVYNIFTHHTRFNYWEIKAIMPSNSVFITILRDPVFLFESLYIYYGLQNNFRGFSLKDLSIILYSNSANRTKINFNKRFLGKFGRNQMSFDLGLDTYFFDNLQVVKQFIRKLDSIFKLVMIAERMDESLILLRHLLCWPIHNVIVFKHNVRYRLENDSLIIKLNETTRTKFRILNKADQLLYTYFYEKFELQVKDFGYERMKNEIQILKYETQKLYLKCVERELLLSDLLPNSTYKLPNSEVLGFKLKNKSEPICWSLSAPELLYTDFLRQKQLYLFPPNWVTTKPIKNSIKKSKKT